MTRQAPIRRKGQVGQYAHQLMIGLAVAGPIVFASATAAPPPMNGLGPSARVLSDDELGEMRGRYIELSQVSFFGLSMVAMWQTADNSVVTTSLEFEVNVQGGAFEQDAQLWATVSENCNGGCDQTLNIPNTTPQGLTTVTGAVQSTELTGDDNDAVNLMQVRIGDYNSDSVEYGGNGELITDTTEHQLANGFAVRFEKGTNQLGMILQGSAKGAEGQSIQNIGTGDTNQIGQHIQLVGDLNSIQNSLDVVVGVNQQLINEIAVEGALSAMKGWGF